MAYRFVRVTSNYPQYLQSIYAKNPGLETQSYADQYRLLTRDSFESAISYTRNLNQIGVHAFDIISNAVPLQNAWRKENNLPPSLPLPDVITEQLKYHQPEVVWIDDFSIVTREWKTSLLKKVPAIKLLIGHICAPYHSGMVEKFRLFDLMFTCIPCLKNQLEELGINSHLLYHGFDAEVLNRLGNCDSFPASDFLFSGSLYSGSGFHTRRIEFIEKILESGIKVDLYCNLESRAKITSKIAMYHLIHLLKNLKLESLIRRIPYLKNYEGYGDHPIHYYSGKLIQSSHPPVFGLDMFHLLSRAKICFNMHGEVAEKCAGNIRLFEATGVGACLVTDWKDNLTDLFEPGKEIITYKTAEECIEKVNWLLNHPSEREKIAKAGQLRTLKDHSIAKRVKAMDEVVRNRLSLQK